MIQAETLTKEQQLTPEQQKHVTRIQNQMMRNMQRSTSEKVKQACEDMDKLNIPKQMICQLVCARAGEIGLSPDYLRTFVPWQYKNQAQRDISLTRSYDSSKNLPGIDNLSQHETDAKEIQITKPEDFHVLNTNKPENVALSFKQKYEDLQKKYVDFTKSQKPSAQNKRIQVLEHDLSLAYKIISQYKKDFADNYQTKYSQWKAENEVLRTKNEKINHIFKILIQVHDNPDTSDQMVADTVRDLTNKWYEEYGIEVKQELNQQGQEQEQLSIQETVKPMSKVKSKSKN